VSAEPHNSIAGCALIGAGGHARVVAATLIRLGVSLEAVFEADADAGGRACWAERRSPSTPAASICHCISPSVRTARDEGSPARGRARSGCA
jgi:hypothetical protein